MKKFFPCLLLLAAFQAAHATTWVIEVDGSGDVPTIQDGLEAAADGDTILVMPGTYTWSNQGASDRPSSFRGMIQLYRGLSNDLVIRSQAGAQQTILNGQFQGRIFYTSGDVTQNDEVALRFTIDGFTFQNGHPRGGDPVTNQWGGAIATHLATPTVRNCVFVNNRANNSAGAVWIGGQNLALFEDCVFRGNFAPLGGAVICVNSEYQETFRRCWFEGNAATLSTGGALYSANTKVTLEDCVFIRNGAAVGGSAIRARYSKPLILQNCFIWGGLGGVSAVDADYVAGPDAPTSSTQIEIYNTVIADNDNLGLRLDANVDAQVGCTNIFGHSGGSWIGNAAAFRYINGNRNDNPHFCSATPTDLLVCDRSKVLDANNGDCQGSMGLLEAGCGGCIVAPPPNDGGGLSVVASPNPFRESVLFDLDLPTDAHLKMRVYDLSGRLVCRLYDAAVAAGPFSYSWNGVDDQMDVVRSGIYVVEIEAGDHSERRRVALIR